MSLISTSEMLWPVRIGNAKGAAGAPSILRMLSLLIGVDGSKVVSNCGTQTEKQAGTIQSSCAEHVCCAKAIKHLEQMTLILV